MNNIEIEGARVHNLKNVDVTIPRNSLTVITGLSGSGKSSLAFDTIFAEGQRRYIETFSAYVRNFLGGMERPDVDKVSGLSPVISIEQKTTNKNPRSTVGTVTEIYDYLRLLYARAGEAYSYETGEHMVKYTEEQIAELLLKQYEEKAVYILAPVVRSRKGHYHELFENIRRKGYLYARIDGSIEDISGGMRLDRYKNHNIEVVVDKLKVSSKDVDRLKHSLATAMTMGDGQIMVLDKANDQLQHYSKRLMCPTTGICYHEPAPNNFSFNSPEGACPHCKGLGFVTLADVDKIIPDRSLSVHDGGLAPLGKYKNSMIFWQIQAVLERHGYELKDPINDFNEEVISEILYGSTERIRIPKELVKTSSDFYTEYEGLVKYINQLRDAETSASAQKWAESFDRVAPCPVCHGARLNKEALHFRIDGKNIYELSTMDLKELFEWLDGLEDLLE